MNAVTWLATGLVDLRAPDPATAPADLARVLGDAFLQSWDGRLLVDQVAEEVRRRSAGEVTLRPASAAGFALRPRGPAAYLVLTATRRVLIVPDPAAPVQFDRTAGPDAAEPVTTTGSWW